MSSKARCVRAKGGRAAADHRAAAQRHDCADTGAAKMTHPRLGEAIIGGALLGFIGAAVITGLTACRAFQRRARYRYHAARAHCDDQPVP